MYALLILLIAFCATTGVSLASHNVTAWGVLAFAIAALCALEAAYAASAYLLAN